MSIDPSSIPNFGGQPDPEPTDPRAAVVPDQDLVKQLLDQMELKYVVDDEGDLAAPWEEFRTYFMFRGEEDQQVFSVRTFYDRPHTIDEKPQLLEVDRRLEPPHPVAEGLHATPTTTAPSA